jgi:SPP1 family predicted phage head-tail adaptor
MINRINENAGSLNERVSVLRATRAADGVGGYTTTNATVATFWASVSPMSGKERDMASQTESPRNYRITVRRSPLSLNVLASDTIVWRSKAMNIRFIGDAGPHAQYLTIEAEEGVAT